MHITTSRQPGWPSLPPEFAFRMASNIAEDSSGRLYFVHRGRHPLVRFDRSGRFIDPLADEHLTKSVNLDISKNPPTPIGSEFWLHGLNIDSSDNIWITDLGRHLVMKFDDHGHLLMTLGTDGKPGNDTTHFNQPTSVVVGPSGSIYVADGYGNSRIVKFSADGEFMMEWGRRGTAPGELNTPHCLALDVDENVYVAERLNHRVQVFDSAGRQLALWPNLTRADSVLVDRHGTVFVGTGHPENAIHRFDREGNALGLLGAGSNAFGYPHGIHIDREGNLYVADPVAEQASASPAKFTALSDA